ncbi:MAG TPA: glycoside hydrolase family 3 N-terminal domain-containing protein [Thermoanaerobaculia bacterium]|nr:glycoside hydrolase family 3 N-terminal domain-containing protein [Thermoanaerobaculia bacterium]
MTEPSRLFGVGISGPALLPAEREILETFAPWAVILFKRNIQSVEQLSGLTAELRELPGEPLLCVDEEGGPVDRFRDLLGPTVSFREAAERGVSRRAGELAGEACARLGFDVDLAPVVDRLLPGASERVLRDRCASPEPEAIVRSALDFLAGLHSRGVGGCVKHFPGLGRADLDTHKELPLIPPDPVEEERDLAPFSATMNEAGAVMISHAAGPDGIPASLSKEKASTLLRSKLGFGGAAFSDDLEMGALSAFGGMPERVAAASIAGCDLLFVCSRIAEYPACVAKVAETVPPGRIAEAAARLNAYRGRLGRLRAAVSRGGAGRSLEDLKADIAALREARA